MDTVDQKNILSKAPTPQNIKILIIDDDIAIQVFIREVLTSGGYNVVGETNPLNALEIAKNEQPDIILLDIVMPKMSGFEVMLLLKEHADTQNIPVIFLTILSELENKIKGFSLGGIDYLTKPLDSGKLLIRINRHLEVNWLRISLQEMIEKTSNQLNVMKANLDKTYQFISGSGEVKKISSLLDEGIIKINQQSICIFSNDAAAYFLGYQHADETIGTKIFLTNKKRKSTLYSNLKKWEFKEIEYWPDAELLRKDGTFLPVEFTLTPQPGSDGENNAVIHFNDISIRKSVEANIYSQAYQDSLTNLSNRTVFVESLQRKLTSYKSTKNIIAVCILDLDFFKEINDQLGHFAGDVVLCEVAARLEKLSKLSENVARLGGDEFSLIHDSCVSIEELQQFALYLSDVLQVPLSRSHEHKQLSDVHIDISVSIGITIIDGSAITPEEIMMQADLALYKAKVKRKGTFCFFQPEMLELIDIETSITREMSRILSEDQLVVEYQPQYDIVNNRYVGVEALVRWEHPLKGRLMPEQFLPIAEKRGFIKKISSHVFKLACKQIKKWNESNIDFKNVSINICAQQVNDKNFYFFITSTLKKYQISPDSITLEVTETALANIEPPTAKMINQLVDMGIKFAFDNFGGNYSSLQIIKKLNSDKLKIDKGFIKNIETDEKSRQIIKSLIFLGKSLGMKVVGEGVENFEQLNFLKKNGCDIYQGFYTNPPMSPDKLLTVL